MVVDTMSRIRQSPVISILRGIKSEALEPVLDALYNGGIRNVEITMNTAGALEMMETARRLYGGRMCIGAGTVLDEISALSAIRSGADFLLSPILSIEMIEMCNMYGKLAVPGVFTATEVLTAQKAGAQLIKIFPVGSVGASYIKDLLGPLNHVNLLPVGGVDLSNTGAFMRAGAYAVGVGSSLVSNKDIESGDFAEIQSKAKKFLHETQIGAHC